MKRICFDTSSNYFHSPFDGFLNDPDGARTYFQNQSFKFHAATTFDSSSRKFRDFTDYRKLFEYVMKADELITFNGRICDFIVLEKLVGAEDSKRLWEKPHYDLCGWRNYYSLESAVRGLLPKRIAESFEQFESDRLSKIKSVYNEFHARRLANTYRDAKFTFALFRQYLKSGDTDRTFRDA